MKNSLYPFNNHSSNLVKSRLWCIHPVRCSRRLAMRTLSLDISPKASAAERRLVPIFTAVQLEHFIPNQAAKRSGYRGLVFSELKILTVACCDRTYPNLVKINVGPKDEQDNHNESLGQ